jgi:xanthine dehydrogenase YagS FAD-binding subunit
MKERVDEPDVLVSLCDAQGLGDVRIEESGAIWIGARVTLAQLAESAVCLRFLPTLAEAAGHAASPQLRHRATIAGNLAQHTRCGYYRHKSFPCLKRGGDSCPVRADGGVQDTAGIFGNQACASAHPSSVAPVLGALDAEIAIRDAKALRFVAFADFWADPAPGRASDTILRAGEVIEGVRVPARDTKQFVGYAEIRQRKAFDWALISCAVRYETDAAGKITQSRAWFGSLAPAPWRAEKAEAALAGQVCSDAAAAAAAKAFLADATPLDGTTFKLQLTKVALKRALAAARERA